MYDQSVFVDNVMSVDKKRTISDVSVDIPKKTLEYRGLQIIKIEYTKCNF